MLTQDQINAILRKKEKSKAELRLIELIRSYMTHSSNKMSTYWPTWEKNEEIYRGYVVPDANDKRNAQQDKPQRLIVPITYAQTQAFLSFFLSLITQRERVFELIGRGPEDQAFKEGLERDLQYQMERSKYYLKLYLWGVNSCNHGFGILRTQWDRQFSTVRTWEEVNSGPVSGMLSGLLNRAGLLKSSISRVETTKEILDYEGATLDVVSPYNFFPDPGVSIKNFQDGEFVFTEEEKSLGWLKNREDQDYFGTEHIEKTVSRDTWSNRKFYVGTDFIDDGYMQGYNKLKSSDRVLLTEGVINIIPKEFSEKFDFDLGESTRPVKYLVTMANGSKIIRFQPYGYLHNKFNFSVMEYSPNNEEFISNGLSSTIDGMQRTISWMFNSHIKNVSKAIKNQFIIDPTKVEAKDIENGSSYIRMKGPSPNIDRVIRQLNVVDVTANHVRDIDVIQKLIQAVTGISDNALGQYSTGRRSAYEAKQVNSGGGSRLRMHASLAFSQGMEELGRLLVANTRQGRSREVYEMILGADIAKYPFEGTILTNPDSVVGGYDFAPLDTTLPSERFAQANMFTELLKSPDLIAGAQLDLRKVLSHVFELMGVRNLDQFYMQQNPQILQPQVVPDDVARQAAASGAPGVDVMGNGLLEDLV